MGESLKFGFLTEMANNEPLIIQCPECSGEMDVSSFPPYSMAACPACQNAFRVRTQLGQYEIQELIGEGGMSQVFAAKDVTLGRIVALKILHQELSQDKKLTAMFEREARLTASISHPNVVKVYTVGEEYGYFYIAMELVDAISIEDRIAKQGAISEDKVLKMAHDVVSGLKAAYQNQLIHRDIKPGNILETKDGTAKLVDFGLAVAQGGADENEEMWATPFYVPPEKLIREPDTFLGDIYALGATCYHAIAGQPPFDANTSSLEELIAIKSAGVDLKSVAPNVSKQTVQLIEQMMAHSPDSRPEDYSKLLEQISACQERLKGKHFHGTASAPKSAAKSSNLPMILIASLVGVLAAGAVVAFILKNKDKEIITAPPTTDLVIAADEDFDRIFTDANKLLAEGKIGVANKTYRELGEKKEMPQPNKTWCTYLRGISGLINDNEKVANTRFGELSEHISEGAGGDDYREFFERIQGVLTDRLPVAYNDFEFEEGSYEMMGLLAVGLKNWQKEEFEEAIRFFDSFEAQKAPSSDAWIEDLKPIIEPFKRDYALFKSIPTPARQMPKSELNGIMESVEASLPKLETSGGMARLMKKISKRAKLIASLNIQPTTPKTTPVEQKPTLAPGEWSSEETAELALLQEMITKIQAGEAVPADLSGVTVSTTKGSILKTVLFDGYTASDTFLPDMIERLNSTGYEGEIIRKQGVPLDGAITAATENQVTIDLGFGPNSVALVDLDSQWLFDAGVKTLPKLSSETSDAWQSAFWYAIINGLEPAPIGRQITGVDAKFKEELPSIRKVQF